MHTSTRNIKAYIPFLRNKKPCLCIFSPVLSLLMRLLWVAVALLSYCHHHKLNSLIGSLVQDEIGSSSPNHCLFLFLPVLTYFRFCTHTVGTQNDVSGDLPPSYYPMYTFIEQIMHIYKLLWKQTGRKRTGFPFQNSLLLAQISKAASAS